jgi:hypothetical protein
MAKIRVRGKNVLVPSAQILGRTVICTGRWLKLAAIHDENLAECETVDDPASFIETLERTGLKADFFTFAQKLPDTTPKYPYHLEWDNLAVIPIATFSYWWERRIKSAERAAVRKSARTGVVVKQVQFNDAFVEGIVKIYNETPVRQGRPFWHFNKSFEAVKFENSTYAERNAFLGAYYQGELVGFVRMIYSGSIAHIIQFLVMMKALRQEPGKRYDRKSH